MPVNDRFSKNFTIAASGTTSDAMDIGEGVTLAGIYLPSALTGTAISFLGCDTEGGTYLQIVTGAGADYSVTVAASKYCPVDYTKFIGVRFLKIKSGSSEAAERIVRAALVRLP